MFVRNQEKILDNSPTLTALGVVNDTWQQGFFVRMFSGLEWMLASPWKFFTLPTALTGDTIRFLLAVANFYNARNKNFDKTAKLVLEILKIATIATAIIGSLIGFAAIASIAPIMFVGAIGANTLYHAGLSVFHAYKWAASIGKNEAIHHKRQLVLNLVATAVGTGMLSSIAFLLAFATPAITAYSLLISTTTCVLFAAGALVSAYTGHNWSVTRAERIAAENQRDKIMEELDTTLPPAARMSRTPVANNSNNNSSQPVNKIKLFHTDLNVEMQQLATDADKKSFITKIIMAKINELETMKPSFDLFGHGLKDTFKRHAKIEALENLQKLINDETITIPGRTEQITTLSDYLIYLEKGPVFQSFYRQVGEVQKIFDLANCYLSEKPKAVAKESLAASVRSQHGEKSKAANSSHLNGATQAANTKANTQMELSTHSQHSIRSQSRASQSGIYANTLKESLITQNGNGLSDSDQERFKNVSSL